MGGRVDFLEFHVSSSVKDPIMGGIARKQNARVQARAAVLMGGDLQLQEMMRSVQVVRKDEVSQEARSGEKSSQCRQTDSENMVMRTSENKGEMCVPEITSDTDLSSEVSSTTLAEMLADLTGDERSQAGHDPSVDTRVDPQSLRECATVRDGAELETGVSPTSPSIKQDTQARSHRRHLYLQSNKSDVPISSVEPVERPRAASSSESDRHGSLSSERQGSLVRRLNTIGGMIQGVRALIRSDLFGANAEVQEMFQNANTVQLRESMWDVSLFLFYKPLGWSANLFLLLSVILTILLQTGLCTVILFLETTQRQDPLESLDAFTTWRDTASSRVVLAVCTEDHSLTTSYFQAMTFDMVDRYTALFLNSLSAGFLLCCLVLTVWVLTELRDLGLVLDKLLGVWHATAIMSTRTLELQVFRTSHSAGLKVISIPWHRLVWFCAMCLTQTIISIAILMGGTVLLISTQEIDDLLLNCVALSYIFGH